MNNYKEVANYFDNTVFLDLNKENKNGVFHFYIETSKRETDGCIILDTNKDEITSVEPGFSEADYEIFEDWYNDNKDVIIENCENAGDNKPIHIPWAGWDEN